MRCDRFVSVTGAIASEPGWRSRFQALIEDKTKDFVGREYVFNAIADFLTNQPNGYFIIEGDPGMGKSPILAEYIYINLERWLHHNLIGYRVKPVYMRFNDRTHQQRPSLILDSVRSPSNLRTLKRSRKPLRNYLVRHNPLWLKPLIV